MILTIDWVSSKYQAYRKKDVNGTIQEYVNTEYGATTCVSIAGMDTSWLTVPGEKDYATLMPIVSIKEIIPGKIDITDSSSASLCEIPNHRLVSSLTIVGAVVCHLSG